MLRRPWRTRVRDLCHYRNCAASKGAKMCHGRSSLQSLEWSFPLGSSHLWSSLLLMSPQPDRTYDLKIGQPTVSYFLKQAAGIAKGAGKTGEACCCKASPRSGFYLLSCLCNTRLPWHPSTDVIFMSQNDSRKRIIHFCLLLCGETF